MPRNIEIKARLQDRSALLERLSAMADGGPTPITQDDSFFTCPNGRLKLRSLAPDRGQLIFYRRADEASPKTSSYEISTTSEPEALRDVLEQAWGCIGRVHKQRLLYHVGRTRVHVDQVAGLGDFVELEVMLSEDEAAEHGQAEAHRLMRALGIAEIDLVQGAYLDLLNAQTRPA